MTWALRRARRIAAVMREVAADVEHLEGGDPMSVFAVQELRRDARFIVAQARRVQLLLALLRRRGREPVCEGPPGRPGK